MITELVRLDWHKKRVIVSICSGCIWICVFYSHILCSSSIKTGILLSFIICASNRDVHLNASYLKIALYLAVSRVNLWCLMYCSIHWRTYRNKWVVSRWNTNIQLLLWDFACGLPVARWLVFHCHPSFSISHLIKLQLGGVQLRKPSSVVCLCMYMR